MKTFLHSTLLAAALPAIVAPAPPPTLLELAGVHSVAVHLSESTVIIIDAQREYVDGRLPLAGGADALRQTQRLLARARGKGVPIVHVQQIGAPDRGIFDPNGAMVSFAAEAMPIPGETVLTKKLPNAFAGTSLEDHLRKLGRKELIISGYMTHMCVSATVRSALDHGFHAIVIADACATRDLSDPGGGTIPYSSVHRVALAELADRFATIAPTLDSIPD
jgi:nicotinamidase-related amidase